MRSAPLVLVVALAACNPPIDLNAAPRVTLVGPEEGLKVNQGASFDVVVDVIDKDGDPLTVDVVSNVDGPLGDAVPAVTGDEVTVHVDTTALTWGPHQLTVTVSDGTAEATAQVDVVINGAPTPAEIEVTPADPSPDDDVVASVTKNAIDPEGSLIVYSWTWKLDGTSNAVFDATLPAEETNKGDTWTVTLKASEADANGDIDPSGITVETSQSVVIGDSAPTAPGEVEILPSQPHPSNNLRCVVTTPSTDADGDTITYSYAWKLGGADSGYTGEFLIGPALVPGDAWSCVATPSDGLKTGPSTTSPSVTIGAVGVDVGAAAIQIDGDTVGQQFGRYAVGASIDAVVDKAGRGDDLVVGIPAYKASVSETNPSGMIAVFRGGALANGDISKRSASLKGNTGAALGGPIARLPDLDGDGQDEVLATGAGSALLDPAVFVIPSETVSNALPPYPYGATLLQSSTGDAGFGASLAGGDFDGDGAGDVFVGRDGGAQTSDVYVFTSSDVFGAAPNGSCDDTSHACLSTLDAYATLHGASAGDGFGSSMASGDVDGDGDADLLVAAPSAGAGSVAWLYTADDLMSGGSIDTTSATATFTWATASGGGAQAAILSDLDGDGFDELLLSAPDEDLSGAAVGVVGILFGGTSVKDTVDFLASADVRVYGQDDGAGFGTAVAALGDLGFDGLPELAVAAPHETASGRSDAGVVHVFSGADLLASRGLAISTSDAVLQLRGEATNDELTVAGPAGDLDLDGVTDLLAASPDHAAGIGRMYVFLTGR